MSSIVERLWVAIIQTLGVVYIFTALVVFGDKIRQAEVIDLGAIANALIKGIGWIFFA